MLNKQIKSLLLPTAIAVLAGCGSDTNDASNNIAPVLTQSELEVAHSSVYENANKPGQIEWDFTFQESDDVFTQPNGEVTDYYVIDLLQGVEDPDGDYLSVEDINFIWVGADCSNFTARQNYPEVCDPILAHFGLTKEDSTTWEQDQEIKKYQNLPLVTDPIYGFELHETSLKVTPSKFAPVLDTDQTAELAMVYYVSDGKEQIERRIKVEVVGENRAPIFLHQNEFGEPILDENLEEQPVEDKYTKLSLSEKSSPVKVNLLYGIYDRDVADVKALEAEIGDLANTYDDAHYKPELITVHSFTKPAGLIEGTATQVSGGYREGVGQYKYEFVFDPSPYKDDLARGETKELVFNYIVTDGVNDVPRSFTFTIVGANEKNEPLFDDADFVKTVSNVENTLAVDLAEGAYDLDGDVMSVVDFAPAAGSEDQYGIDTSEVLTTRRIMVEPYAFTNLKPGDTQSFVYTYKLTDGELTSVERKFTIEIVGGQSNLFALGTNSDPGLEQGSLAAGPFAWQWSPTGEDKLEVNAGAARTGSYGLEAKEDNVFIRLNSTGFKEGTFSKNDRAYLNYWVTSNNWQTVRVTLNQDYDYDKKFNLTDIPDNGGKPGQWIEHTMDLVDLDEKVYGDNAKFDFTFQTNARKLDDFSLIKYNYAPVRDLIPEGDFSDGIDGGWKATGTATLEVSEEANRVQGTDDVQYGLKVTGGASGGEITLDTSVFPQGKFKSGVRYIAQLDLKHPTFVDKSSGGAGPQPIYVRVRADNGTMSQKMVYAKKSATAWNTYYIHINNQADSEYFFGKLNTDVNYDWLSASGTTFSIAIPANHTYLIDNIRFFPVPQY
ncbi:hypothetical protein DS2_02980 [Catenovulum agarivorans DS-2]|uniref:CBM-cenC domain-containing protein n=1 Tax=Catenovulum agarivorans DS-2 TaxID=1328313 RepID=W7QVJ7_9ALTE|nr:hypothetical protein [Catenovulum agarivorans]EWH11753.1 hypothetical protein DS2_02980 [Catenovulum agarivorans DS-2]